MLDGRAAAHQQLSALSCQLISATHRCPRASLGLPAGKSVRQCHCGADLRTQTHIHCDHSMRVYLRVCSSVCTRHKLGLMSTLQPADLQQQSTVQPQKLDGQTAINGAAGTAYAAFTEPAHLLLRRAGSSVHERCCS